MHVQHKDELAKAAEREGALEAQLLQKDASAEGSSTALAAAQQKHDSALQALLASHAAAVKQMQVR